MHRHGKLGLSLALLALAAGSTEARPLRQPLPAASPPERPHLVIVEADGGFVIRCEMSQGPRRLHDPQSVPFPRGAIPLGTSIRIDRAALLPTQQKDNDHGEIR